MTLDDLYIRKAELERNRDDADDKVTEISLAIDNASEFLQEARSDYLINPANAELVAKQKEAQCTFDNLVEDESLAIRGKRDLDNAITTINTRIRSQEHAIEQKANSALRANIPEKISVLETEVLRSMARFQAAQALNGTTRSEPQLAIIRLINSQRGDYMAFYENAKSELREELSSHG